MLRTLCMLPTEFNAAMEGGAIMSTAFNAQGSEVALPTSTNVLSNF